MAITVAQYYGKEKKSQVICRDAAEARKALEEGNATAAKGWRWGLCDTTFVGDDGVEMDIAEANEIRRACGVAEY